jgi:hypothetical protein
MLYTLRTFEMCSIHIIRQTENKNTDISSQSSIWMCLGAENGRFPALFGLLITINYVFRLKE